MVDEIIKIANEYRLKYKHKLEGSTLIYKQTDITYHDNWNQYYDAPVWNVVYDVDGFDDIWYSIIVSDSERVVVCCSCWQNMAYFPHVQYPNKLLENIDKLIISQKDIIKINRNIQLDTNNIIKWCVDKVKLKDSVITKKGKNWHVEVDGFIITIKASNYQIINITK